LHDWSQLSSGVSHHRHLWLTIFIPTFCDDQDENDDHDGAYFVNWHQKLKKISSSNWHQFIFKLALIWKSVPKISFMCPALKVLFCMHQIECFSSTSQPDWALLKFLQETLTNPVVMKTIFAWNKQLVKPLV
jgi:hypothetical protein